MSETRHVDAGHPHRLAGGRHAHQRATIRGACNPTGGHPVAFGDLIVNGDVPITKAAAEDRGDHFHAFRPIGPAARRGMWVMSDVIGRENLVGNDQLALGDDVREPTAGGGFILFG